MSQAQKSQTTGDKVAELYKMKKIDLRFDEREK